MCHNIKWSLNLAKVGKKKKKRSVKRLRVNSTSFVLNLKETQKNFKPKFSVLHVTKITFTTPCIFSYREFTDGWVGISAGSTVQSRTAELESLHHLNFALKCHGRAGGKKIVWIVQQEWMWEVKGCFFSGNNIVTCFQSSLMTEKAYALKLSHILSNILSEFIVLVFFFVLKKCHI